MNAAMLNDFVVPHENCFHAAQVTVFLIGAYAKYNWPYVWVSRDEALFAS